MAAGRVRSLKLAYPDAAPAGHRLSSSDRHGARPGKRGLAPHPGFAPYTKLGRPASPEIAWVANAVGQQLGNPGVRPLVPKAASQPFGAHPREQTISVHGREKGVGWWVQVPCPRPAPKDWRRPWNRADPNCGASPHINTVPLRGTTTLSVSLGSLHSPDL